MPRCDWWRGSSSPRTGGTPALKGISTPIRVYRVIQPSGVASRLDRAPRLTPFVGREQELGLLLDRFEQAQERRGQAVLVAGEAGIGKSRLVHRLRERTPAMSEAKPGTGSAYATTFRDAAGTSSRT
jgi:hypothetical protein